MEHVVNQTKKYRRTLQIPIGQTSSKSHSLPKYRKRYDSLEEDEIELSKRRKAFLRKLKFERLQMRAKYRKRVYSSQAEGEQQLTGNEEPCPDRQDNQEPCPDRQDNQEPCPDRQDNQEPCPDQQLYSNASIAAETDNPVTPVPNEGQSQERFFFNFGLKKKTNASNSFKYPAEHYSSDTLSGEFESNYEASSSDSLELPIPKARSNLTPQLEHDSCDTPTAQSKGAQRNNLPTSSRSRIAQLSIRKDGLYLSSSSSQSSIETISSDSVFGLYVKDKNKNQQKKIGSTVLKPCKKRKFKESKSPKDNGVQIAFTTPISKSPVKSSPPNPWEDKLKMQCKVILKKIDLNKNKHSKPIETILDVSQRTAMQKYNISDSKIPVVKLQRLNNISTIVNSPPKKISREKCGDEKEICTVIQKHNKSDAPRTKANNTAGHERQGQSGIQIVVPSKKKPKLSKMALQEEIQKNSSVKKKYLKRKKQNIPLNYLTRPSSVAESGSKTVVGENNPTFTTNIEEIGNNSVSFGNQVSNDKSHVEIQSRHLNCLNSIPNSIPVDPSTSSFTKKNVNISAPKSSIQTIKNDRKRITFNTNVDNADKTLTPLVEQETNRSEVTPTFSVKTQNNLSAANHVPSFSQREFAFPRPVCSKSFTKIGFSNQEDQIHASQEPADNDADTTSVLSLFVSSELQREVDRLTSIKTASQPQGRRNIKFCSDKDGSKSQALNKPSKDLQPRFANGINEFSSYQENTQTTDASNWLNLNTHPSLSDFAEDPFYDTSILSGTSFQGYCIDYMRTNHHHQCSNQHTVPLILYQTERYGDGERIAEAIEIVIRNGFNNPPLKIIQHFVSFCVISNRINVLEKLAKRLNENITLSYGNEGYVKDVWKCYIYNYLKATKTSGDRQHLILNGILRNVFTTNGEKIGNIKILQIVLEILADATLKYRNFQALKCVEFLKDTIYLRNSPQCFKLNVTKQANAHSSDSRCSVKFVYKVYKTFYEDPGTPNELHKADPNTVEKFFEILCHAYPTVRNPFKTTTFNRSSSLILQSGSFDEERQVCAQEDRNWRHSSGPSAFSINNRQIQDENIEQFIIKNKANPSSISKIMSDFNLNEINIKLVYQTFKNLKYGERIYLKMIQECKDDVKELLNDVTLSFMLIEAKKLLWFSAYDFYKEVKNRTSTNITEDSNGRKLSPAKVVLHCISICLNAVHLEEAVSLVIEYGFHKTDSTKWLVSNEPSDISYWNSLRPDFHQSFQSAEYATDLLQRMLIKLMSAQRSLREPVDLMITFKKLVTRLLNEEEYCLAAELLNVALELKLLKEFMLEDNNQYRVLVIKMVQFNYGNAHILLYKGKKRVKDYPDPVSNDCNVIHLKTNLTSEEMYAVLFLKNSFTNISLLQENVTIIFEEYKGPLPVGEIPELRKLDCSIPAAIGRFKKALKNLFPRGSCYTSTPNTIIIDRFTLKEN